ncbi:hypothetical protein FE156_30065 [Streptomyces albidoflavus]|nr:hypothetical protein FE156_30065 [Streptomyces albidoflavus]
MRPRRPVGRRHDRQVSALRGFGHHVGMVFQLVDDLLGIWGDPRATGKVTGTDLSPPQEVPPRGGRPAQRHGRRQPPRRHLPPPRPDGRRRGRPGRPARRGGGRQALGGARGRQTSGSAPEQSYAKPASTPKPPRPADPRRTDHPPRPLNDTGSGLRAARRMPSPHPDDRDDRMTEGEYMTSTASIETAPAPVPTSAPPTTGPAPERRLLLPVAADTEEHLRATVHDLAERRVQAPWTRPRCPRSTAPAATGP